MMTKELAMGYLPSNSFLYEYENFKKKYSTLPIRWETPHRLKGLFFSFRREGAVEELIKNVHMLGLPKEQKLQFNQLNLYPNDFSPKQITVRAVIPSITLSYLKELAKEIKRSLAFQSPFLELSLGKIEKGRLQLKHIEALKQYLCWEDSIDQLVLIEKRKGVFYTFEDTSEESSSCAALNYRSYLKAK